MAALTVYVFFATWCVPCRQEMPHIARIEREFRDRGVRFVLVAEDAPSTAAQIPAFLARFGADAEVVIDAESVLLERFNPAADIPFTAVVDASGAVVFARAGYQPGDERLLEQFLATPVEPPAPGTTVNTAGASSRTLGLLRRDDYQSLDTGRAAALFERLDLAERYGPLGAALRLDGDALDVGGDREGQATVEKLSFEARASRFRLLAGDGYAALGQGLLLSVRRIDPLGLDTTVRGGRGDLRLGSFEATVLGGVMNPQNADTIALRHVGDPGDVVLGGEMRERATSWLRLSQAAAWFRARSGAPDGGAVEYTVAGLAIDGDGRRVRGRVGAAGLARTGLAASTGRELGHAAYARAALGSGSLTTLVEAKSYRRFMIVGSSPSLVYHEPPSLERDDQEIPGNADSLGARARTDWRTSPSTTIFASAMGYRFSQDGTSPEDGPLALHGYAGADGWFMGGASAAGSLGVRREVDPDGSERRAFLQANADAAAPLGARWSLTAKWDHRWERKALFDGNHRFVKGLGVVGLTYRSRVTLSGLYGYSTEAAARPRHYPGGEIRIVFGSHGDVRLFAGRLVGGRVCVSGACRDIPSFEGVRMDLQVRY